MCLLQYVETLWQFLIGCEQGFSCVFFVMCTDECVVLQITRLNAISDFVGHLKVKCISFSVCYSAAALLFIIVWVDLNKLNNDYLMN